MINRRSFLAAASPLPPSRNATGAANRLTRYPDPDVVVLDPRFAKIKIGNTAHRAPAHRRALGGGPGLERVGRYLVWSDIPNDRQLRWIEEDGHVSIFRSPSHLLQRQHVRL